MKNFHPLESWLSTVYHICLYALLGPFVGTYYHGIIIHTEFLVYSKIISYKTFITSIYKMLCESLRLMIPPHTLRCHPYIYFHGPHG